MNPSPTTMPTAGGLDIAGLEAVFDRLAQAIDAAGADHSELFLVKLALLNAQALGDAERFNRHVQAALQDLRRHTDPTQPASATGLASA